jgi:hypothetical protein
MPPRTKKRRKPLQLKPHIESYQIVQKQEIRNGVLYNDEKSVIYNPAIAPYPIVRENHFIKPVPGLEKHVHFSPNIKVYPIKPIKRGEKMSRKRKMSRKKKIPKDSLLLYREKMRR